MKQEKLVFSAISIVLAAIAASTFLHQTQAPLQEFSPEDTGQKNAPAFGSNGSCLNCNLVFISLTILRADHVGAYGYFRNTTPNIDALAREGALFENTFAQAGWTRPSYVSVMTSLYPHVHGVENRNLALPENALTLAEILKAYGYRTAAFTSGNVDTGNEIGLAQGFETYDDTTDHEENPPRPLRFSVASALKWLNENETYKKPFFLALESSRLHCPYGTFDYQNPFEDYQSQSTNPINRQPQNRWCKEAANIALNLSSTDVKLLNGIYDWLLVKEDRAMGDAIAMLDELGVLNKTIIVLFSPHGEEFYEHELIGHGLLYDSVIRVPLIIKMPKSPGGRKTKALTQLIDLMPTTLDLLGIPINHQAQGKSAAAFVKGTGGWEGNEHVFSEQLPNSKPVAKKLSHEWAVRTGEWKYVQGKSYGEFYNLAKDPSELINLFNTSRAPVSLALEIYEQWLNQTLPKALSQKSVSEETLKKIARQDYP